MSKVKEQKETQAEQVRVNAVVKHIFNVEDNDEFYSLSYEKLFQNIPKKIEKDVFLFLIDNLKKNVKKYV